MAKILENSLREWFQAFEDPVRRQRIWDLGLLTGLRERKGSDPAPANFERGLILDRLIEVRRPKRILEIGTGRGLGCLSMAAACRAHGAPAEIFTVDITPRDRKIRWALELKGEKKVVHASRDEIWQAHIDPELLQPVHQLTGTSVQVLSKLARDNERFDLIFIDAGHDLFSVVYDLCYSARLLNEGGMILMDDFAPMEDFGIGTCMVVSHARRWFNAVEIIESENVIYGPATATPRGMVALSELRAPRPSVDNLRMLWWRLAGFVVRACESEKLFPLRG
ncbi:MAG: uncharacterized protein JWL59_4111 [Chthoniobacteraceae bacterium]|nr:uncharacterized protein [Chthoniobacteraceae bacterium]